MSAIPSCLQGVRIVPPPSMGFDALKDEQDIYSQETLQTLQSQRFELGLDLYICVVKKGGRAFYFDASKFMEHCIQNDRVIYNPLTREPINTFEIYISTQAHPDFQLAMTRKEALEKPNFYPVYWNDSDLPLESRLSFMMLYARHFESTDLEEALRVYKLAAERGSLNAKIRLATHYSDEAPDQTQAVKYLKACIKEEKDVTTTNIYALGRRLARFQEPQWAFRAFKIMADRGNMFGVGLMIRSFEQGIGTDQSPIKAAEWRQKLPEGRRDKTMEAFFKHLKAIRYAYGSNGYTAPSK